MRPADPSHRFVTTIKLEGLSIEQLCAVHKTVEETRIEPKQGHTYSSYCLKIMKLMTCELNSVYRKNCQAELAFSPQYFPNEFVSEFLLRATVNG
jgi:hypothetical protein